MKSRVIWGGNSYSIYEPGEPMNDVPGVFLFCKRNTQGQWLALYVGQTASLAELYKHKMQWQNAECLEATHIHTMPMMREHLRKMVVNSLINRYKPCLNGAHSLREEASTNQHIESPLMSTG